MTGLGTSIVMAGDEVFIGRPGEFSLFPMPASRPGGVTVFGRSGDSWTERHALQAGDGSVGNLFGQAIAVDGNRVAVGAPHADGRGAVYVFERPGPSGAWRQTARLVPAEAGSGAGFGSSVALEGEWLVGGAPGQAGGGAAYVYRYDGGGWQLSGTLASDSVTDGDGFGSAVAISDGQLLIGAPGPLPFSLLGAPESPRAGAAYVMRRSGGEWREEARLTADGSLSLGFAVAWWEGTAFASAPVTDGVGAVYAFTSANGSWATPVVIRRSEQGNQSMFGFSLGVSGNALLIGAPFAQAGQGAVYAFESSGGAWTERQTLTRSLMGLTTFYGGAVAVTGSTAIVGAPGADFFEGVGVAYRWSPAAGEWQELTSLVDESPGLAPVTGGQVDCTDGKAGDWTCQDVDLLAFLPLKSLGADRGITVNDIWGWTDSLTGKEYAIVGRSDATVFIDVSDPANPVYLGFLPLTATAHINIWRDIKVYRNHAFIVADGAGQHGMQVFDLTNLRSVSGPPVEFEETAHYDRIFSAHNIVINERTGFAYAVGSSAGGETCGGGLHMIDIRDPANPTFAGCFADPTTGMARTGYSHDAQCVNYQGPDTEYTGHEICFGSNETALSVADVTDKENPVAISSGTYPSVAYAHQGWVSDDHRYFFMDDEGDELTGGAPRTRTLVWDIEDLDDPVLLTEFMGTTQASDHNLYVRGNYMYQSNYVSGLRIIDISDPAQPKEVGFFDTVPTGEDVPGFAGSWSNFPFFDSGTIVVTSMREGVFILKKQDQRPIP